MGGGEEMRNSVAHGASISKERGNGNYLLNLLLYVQVRECFNSTWSNRKKWDVLNRDSKGEQANQVLVENLECKSEAAKYQGTTDWLNHPLGFLEGFLGIFCFQERINTLGLLLS